MDEIQILSLNSKSENSNYNAQIINLLNTYKNKCKKCKDNHIKFTNSDKIERTEYRRKYSKVILNHFHMVHGINTSNIVKNKARSEEIEPEMSRASSIEMIEESEMQIQTSLTLGLTKKTESKRPRIEETENENSNTPKEQIFTPREYRIHPQVPVRNTFQVLDPDDDMNIELVEDDEPTNNRINGRAVENDAPRTTGKTNNPRQKTSRESNNDKARKPPPLIIAGIVNENNRYKALTNQLKQKLTKGFSLKFTKNNTIIQAHDLDEYKEYREQLRNDNQQFHTYATYEEKTHAFVIKGLDHRPSIEDLKYELKEQYDMEVRQIHIMETRYRVLYLVITPVDYKLSNIKNKIKILNHVEIQWERRRQVADMTQCRKCCMWGHATSHCYRATKCMKCAGPHKIKTDLGTCTNEDKCANCGGKHTANNRECPVYCYKMDMIREKQPAQQQQRRQYIEAPAPKNNVWDQRTSQRQQQSTQQQATTQLRQREETSNNRQQAQSESNNFSNFNINNELSDLNSAISDLKNSVNLSEMIRLIQDLANKFKNCRNKIDKLNVTIEFMQNIDNYDI